MSANSKNIQERSSRRTESKHNSGVPLDIVPVVRDLMGNVISKELVLCANNDKEGQYTNNLAKVDNVQNLGNQAHSSNIPTLHFSSPHVEQIIREAQNAMMVNNMVNYLLVTLNTSVFEVPSQSFEFCGEHGGDQGQMVVSTGNNIEVIKANVGEKALNANSWVEQREYDDEEDWG